MGNEKGVLDILNCLFVPFSGYDSPGKNIDNGTCPVFKIEKP